MSYPMNEFVTDLEKSAETACHEAGNELSSIMERGRDFYKTVRKRVGHEANAANAVMHNHPYPPVLVGIGAGALIGYLVACRLNGRSG